MMWRAISASPCVEGIGVAHLNDPGKLNLYNDHSFLLSGYGDLYSFGGSQKGFSPNVSRSVGSRYGVELDIRAGTLRYWLDGVDLGVVKHASLKTGEWYVTVTFGSGASGASFELQHAP